MGPAGPQGPAGVDGKDGVNGKDGVDGKDGKDGVDGEDGAQGPQGPAGPQGPTGPTGNTGSQGPTGAPGPIPPGLQVTIKSATVPATGAPTVTFEIKDKDGVAIDVAKEVLAGTLSPRFSLAARDADTGSYTSLYTSVATGKDYKDAEGVTHTAKLASVTNATYVQPTGTAAEKAARFAKNADGTWTFTFPAAPAAAPNRDQVHMIAFFGTRSVQNVSYPGAASWDFVPATGAAAAKREVVTDAACNKCHQQLQAHGTRRTVGVCLTCHSPQTTDPETGETMDFKVLVHKLHRGAQAGDSATNPYHYAVVGYGQNYMDFSHVAFAYPGNSVKNCAACHQGADADKANSAPSRAACGSCHYEVDFAAGTGHFKQTTDDACAGCHTAQKIADVHSPKYDAANNVLFAGKTLEVVIDDVTNVVAGQKPVVKFTVKVDGQPYDAKTNPIAQLRFTMAGGAGDYSGPGGPAAVGYAQSANFSTAAATANMTAVEGVPGQFTIEMPALPADAKGTLAFGSECYIAEKKNDEGGTARTKYWLQKENKLVFRAVGGGAAAPRRVIADNAKCNNCHVDIGFHSNQSRKGVEYCAFCHNPNNVNDERAPRYEFDPANPAQAYRNTPESVSLAQMIHKIHKGGDLANTYTLGAHPAPTAANPGGVQNTITGLFPGDLGNCETCHKPGSWGLPPAIALPTKFETYECKENGTADTDDYCTGSDWQVVETKFVPAQKAACTSCHDSASAVVHADTMTVNGVESCETCHGTGKTYSSVEVHRPRP